LQPHDHVPSTAADTQKTGTPVGAACSRTLMFYRRSRSTGDRVPPEIVRLQAAPTMAIYLSSTSGSHHAANLFPRSIVISIEIPADRPEDIHGNNPMPAVVSTEERPAVWPNGYEAAR